MHWKALIHQKRDAAENPEVHKVLADSESGMPGEGNGKVLLQIFKGWVHLSQAMEGIRKTGDC